MIDKFTNSEIKAFILLFRDTEFVIDFGKTKVEKRVKNLCEKLKEKTSNNDLIEGLEIIRNSSYVKNISLQSDYTRVEDKIKKSNI